MNPAVSQPENSAPPAQPVKPVYHRCPLCRDRFQHREGLSQHLATDHWLDQETREFMMCH